MAYRDYQELADAHRRQCYEQRQRREAEETERRELTPLVFKTNEDARVASETPKQPVVTPPVVAPDEKQVWWQWTDERIAHALEAHCFNDTQRDVIAQVIAEIRHEWRDGDSAAKRELEREVGFFKREIEQVQRQVDIQIELHALAKNLRDEITVAKDRAIEAEQMNLRRELSLLRQEIAVAKGFEALKSDVAQARADVPRLRDIEARIDARQADLESEQARLERELAKTKDRLGKVRVNQSITDYGLGELRKQVNASAGASIEMEFESRSAHFQMKATHPDAARALKNFATQIIDGHHDGTLWIPGSAGKA
jgi:hypothetical protein